MSLNNPVLGADVVLAELQIKNNPDGQVLDSQRVRGAGWRVATLTDRDAIPLDARRENLTLVYVVATNLKYELVGGVTNEFWKEYSTGGQKIVGNKVVSLTGSKSFGKYVNGDTIPSDGKTWDEVLEMSLVEALQPTVNLSSPTTINFNQTAISNVLNFGYVINSLGANVASVKLEWRRNNAGPWTTLTTNPALTTYTHTLTDSAFNTQPFNYQYTVTDSAGGTRTVALSITPQAYAAPTINFTAPASGLNGTQTNSLREKGNVSSVLSGTVTSNRPNVTFVSYQWQYRMDGGTWTNIGTVQAISGTVAALATLTHNDVALLNAGTIDYRVLVTDTYQTTTSGTVTITFNFVYKLGYNATNGVLTGAQAYALGNTILSTTKARTVTGVTATAGNYTFILYPAPFGNLAGVIQDGATPVLGAFTQLTNALAVTNQYGVTGNNILYKSNATQAFTNNTLAIS